MAPTSLDEFSDAPDVLELFGIYLGSIPAPTAI